MIDHDLAKLIEIIKENLKSQKISYVTVAKKLNITESAVKKMFHTKSLSIKRILELCEILNMSLESIAASIKVNASAKIDFSEEQIECLLDDDECFNLYFYLITTNPTFSDLKNNLHVDQSHLFKLLLKLDQHDFIKLEKNNEIKINLDLSSHIVRNNPIFLAKIKKLLLNYMENIQMDHLRRHENIEFRNFFLTDGQILEYLTELRKLNDRYVQISAFQNSVFHRSQLYFFKVIHAHGLRDIISKL